MFARYLPLFLGGWFFTVVLSCLGQGISAGDLLQTINIQIKKGAFNEALASANQLIQLEPNSAQGYITRGNVYEIQGEYAKAIADFTKALSFDNKSFQILQLRGAAYFRSGKVTEAIADFDQVLRLDPKQAPYHWQRGIALYEAERFDAGRKQFELHQVVNTNDVENAAWHFLCVAKSKSFDEARKSLLKITGDPRVPMMEIYSFYQGKGTIDDIFNAAKNGSPNEKELNQRLFYANLYVGMFFEARGGDQQALDYIKKSIEKSAGMDYMADVARIHGDLLKKRMEAKPEEKKR